MLLQLILLAEQDTLHAGFSQGATVAALLLANTQRQGLSLGLKFAILVSLQQSLLG